MPLAPATRSTAGATRARAQPNIGAGVLVAAVWPFALLLFEAVRRPRRPVGVGFLAFCVLAGSTLVPLAGSDADFMRVRFETAQRGAASFAGEPVISALLNGVALLGVGFNWYLAAVAALYAGVIVLVAKHLFAGQQRHWRATLATVVFVGGFFLNHPVYSAMNARFHLGLWVAVLSVLLWLDGRWRAGSIAAAMAIGVHFGYVLFAAPLAVWIASRPLGSRQLVFAYTVLGVSLVTPPGLLVSVGTSLSSVLEGGSLGGAVTAHVGYAERIADGTFGVGRGGGAPWFLQWFTTPIFWSLLLSGHFLAWRRGAWREPWFRTLWTLIVLVWAMQFFAAGLAEGSSRIQRITTALLLLWHARWFLLGGSGGRVAVALNILPLAFYSVVSYRQFLAQANLATLLPSPFALVPELLPTVTELFGFR